MANIVGSWAGPPMNAAEFINTLANGYGDVYANINCKGQASYDYILILYNASAQPANFNAAKFTTPVIPTYGSTTGETY